MKVQIDASLQRVTISTTSPAMLDPLKFKLAVRQLSFRTILLLLLFAAFCLPFTFVITALVSLDSLQGCSRSADCFSFGGRKGGQPRGPNPSLIPAAQIQRPVILSTISTSSSSHGSLDVPESLQELADLASSQHYDSTAVILKLKAMVELGEEKLRIAQLQRALYRHFASNGVPKGLHCLTLRLTVEQASNSNKGVQPPPSPTFTSNSLLHFVLITDNVLAASVVVSSAVANAAQPWLYVFHIVTNRLAFRAMETWFDLNPPNPASLQVLGLHQMEWLNKEELPVVGAMEASPGLRRHYFGDHGTTDASLETPATFSAKLAARNPKYVSVMNHLRMYLPQVFPDLKKVVFLDDDVVVQKDLSGLWKVPLFGKVMGAVETCHGSSRVMSKHLRTYLNFSHPLILTNFDPEKCAWAYGVNVFDLDTWRASNVTQVYNFWQKKNMESNLSLWRLGTLPPSLIAFDTHMQPIDASWHMLGLGYYQEADVAAIERSAIIHFNGAAKPWLDLAIPEFRHYWTKYVNYSNEMLRKCNIYEL